VSYDIEPYGTGNLSPAQLHATMDPLERMVTEADNNVATVVHERFGTERKLRETAEKYRVADEAWSRAVKSVRKRSKGQEPSPEEHHELMQLGAARRSLEWQMEQYRTRNAELVEIERDLAMHRLDLQVASEEMRVNVDTLRSQQVLQHAQTSMAQMQQTMRRLSSEIDYAKHAGAHEIDRGRAELYVARPRGGRLDQVARDIADELDPD
jgi:hypothetical protein